MVIVDPVTERSANLHMEVLDVLRLTGVPAWQSPTNLYAVAYRMILLNGKHQLDAWREPLTIGAPLPAMPLWLQSPRPASPVNELGSLVASRANTLSYVQRQTYKMPSLRQGNGVGVLRQKLAAVVHHFGEDDKVRPS